MTWIIVGASSGLGRALAERLARDGRSLLLVASDERDVGVLASDLAIVHGVQARALAQDAVDHARLAERVREAIGPEELLEGVLFPLGLVSDEDDATLEPQRAEQIVRVNFTAVVSLVSALLPRMLAARSGTIVGFGSIAAARGRGRNAVYAASKRALESYFESLRHLGEDQGLSVCLYILGYVDTNLAWGRKLPFRPASPALAADRICRELGRARGRRYLPRLWAPLTWALRSVPWFVYKHTRF